MNTRGLLVLVIVSFTLTSLLACSGGSPTPSPAAIVTPVQTAEPKSSVLPSASPTSKPTLSTPSAAVSFGGKTITMIVPQPAGGGGDIIGRVYAKYLPRFLPGNPTIIIRNMTGGAQIIAGNYAYDSKPDGLTSVIASGTFQLNYIMGLSAVKYDLQKMEAILGNAGANIYYTRPNVVARVEDLPKADGIVFGHSTGMPAQIFVSIINLLDIRPKKVVVGYTGGADARRGFLAGEINMTAEGPEVLATSLAKDVARGEVIALLQSGILDEKGELVRDPSCPPIPTVKEAYEKINGKPPSGMAWDAYKAQVAATRAYQSVLLLPPGVPSNILGAYWDAAQNMLKDSDFRKTVDPLTGPTAPWTAGEAYSKQFKADMKMDTKVRDWLRDALAKYGIVFE